MQQPRITTAVLLVLTVVLVAAIVWLRDLAAG